MPFRKRPCCSFSVNTYPFYFSVHLVLFKFRDVMTHVVEELSSQFSWTYLKDVVKSLSCGGHYNLPVCPCVIYSHRKRRKIIPPVLGFDMSAGKLFIGKINSLSSHIRDHPINVVRACLMTKPPRAAVNLHAYLIFKKPECICNRRIINSIYNVY